MNLTEKLNALKGKTFLYNANKIKVLNWTKNAKSYDIVTDLRTISLPIERIFIFMADLKEVLEEAEAPEPVVNNAEEETEKVASNLDKRAVAKQEKEEEAPQKKQEQPTQLITEPAKQAKAAITTMADLKNILLENIEKVKADKEYIPQSEEINKNVKSYIDIVKTEIEAIKLLK